MQHVFTDKQIQEYLDGVYTGDVQAIEQYLFHTDEGQQRLSFYKLLYEALDNEASPVLDFSLEDAVMNALEKREQQARVKQRNWLWIPAIVFGVAVIVYSFISVSNFHYLTALSSNNIYIGLVILTALLLAACHGMDTWQQQKRYKKALGI